MGSKPILDDKDVEQILQLKNEGLPLEKIAEKMFVCHQTVITALRKRGIKLPKGRMGLNKDQIERILLLKSQGLSGNSISKRTGISRHTVNRVIQGTYKPNHIETSLCTTSDQYE